MTATSSWRAVVVWIVTLGVVVLLAVWAVAVFNGLVTLKNRFLNAFAQVDVQLKRRHDLVPNLVETVKGYMAHERGTLTEVVEARQAAEAARQKAAADPSDAAAVAGAATAERALGVGLGKLIALWEAYPDLKAKDAASSLMEELSSTENRIAFARQAYNDAVMRYNTAAEVFPARLVAGALGFRRASLFELEDPGERAVPSARV
jgi:LemA protein